MEQSLQGAWHQLRSAAVLPSAPSLGTGETGGILIDAVLDAWNARMF